MLELCRLRTKTDLEFFRVVGNILTFSVSLVVEYKYTYIH